MREHRETQSIRRNSCSDSESPQDENADAIRKDRQSDKQATATSIARDAIVGISHPLECGRLVVAKRFIFRGSGDCEDLLYFSVVGNVRVCFNLMVN